MEQRKAPLDRPYHYTALLWDFWAKTRLWRWLAWLACAVLSPKLAGQLLLVHFAIIFFADWTAKGWDANRRDAHERGATIEP